MAEAIGLAASVVSLISLARTCIDAYDIVSDAKHASDDLNQLVSSLSIERVRFLLWCQYVGLTDLLRLAEFQPRQENLDPQAVMRLTPRLQRTYVLEGIVSTLRDISRTFQDSRELLSSYTTSNRISFFSTLMAMSSTAAGSMALGDYLWADENARQSARQASRVSMSMKDRSMWAFKDKKKFKNLVDQLRIHNDGLANVLTMVEKNQLRRQNELLVTTTPLARFVSNSASGEAQGDRWVASTGTRYLPSTTQDTTSPHAFLDDGNERLRQLLVLQQRRIDIDEDSEPHLTVPGNQVSQRKRSLSLTTPDLRRLASDITVPLGESSFQQRRLHTYYKKDVPVVVEWKLYSPRIDTDLLTHLKRRVSLLTLQLQQSSQTPDFSILNCLGYFEDVTQHRIGIIFEYPNRRADLKPVSLQERLLQDRSSRTVRGLDQRFAVAKALTLTFYRLHSVGWLHKSFRSDNVLFFETSDQNESDLSTPYVCGFDFARPDSPTELTEVLPTVVLSQMADRERSLYRHPDLDPQSSPEVDKDDLAKTVEAKIKAAEALSKAFRFSKAYDIYSLGIVLLEIGLWHPAKTLCRPNETVKDFRQRIHTKLMPELRYRMGRTYFEIVKKCLNGSYSSTGSESGHVDEQADSATMQERASRKWLEAFLNEAVNELERCSV